MDAIVVLHDLLCVVQFNNEMTHDIKERKSMKSLERLRLCNPRTLSERERRLTLFFIF